MNIQQRKKHMQLLVRNKSLLLSCLVVLLTCIPALLGLFHPGFFFSDDGNWMVIRFSAFYEALRHGQFPVRFLPRLLNGFGYPVADFLYPLFMYLGVPIHIVGFHFVTTIKILFGLSMIGSGIFTFLWLRRLFPLYPALLGTLTLVYFPYHVFDLYTRGSMGEVLALCIVPLILWQIEKKNISVIGLGIGLLIMAHNSLALLFLPVVLAYYFFRGKNILAVFFATVFGLGISMFFWLPALFDQQFTVFQSQKISDISQYFIDSSRWYLFGITGFLGICFGIIGVVKKNKIAISFGIILLVSVVLALPISKFLWDILPLGKYFQFPFRFLSLAVLATSFLISYGLSLTKTKYQLIVFVILGGIIIVSGVFLLPQKYQMYEDSWYSTNQDSTTVKNEYLPLWAHEIPTNKKQVGQIVKGKGEIVSQMEEGTNILIQTNSSTPLLLQLNMIYFPGWKVSVDKKDTQIIYHNTNGLMHVVIPAGNHIVKAAFQETTLRLFADSLSILSLICIAIYALVQYKKS